MKNPRTLIISFLTILLFANLFLINELYAKQRGIKVTAKTPDGKVIPLYSGSYALVIGNGDYTKGWDPLPGAIRDVKDVSRALEENGFQVTLKTNLTKNDFDRVFSDFFYKYGRDINNRLLVYYGGHGHTQKMATEEDLGYLVMVDAPDPDKDPMGFRLSSVDMQTILTEAKMTKAKHVLFLFDSCFSGSILNLREKVMPEAISENMRLPVRQFITAGRGNEPVPDHSIFKQAFLDLLEGRDKEPIPDGYITGEELGLYLKNKVPEYNPTQHPQYGKINDVHLDKGDFVFTIKSASQLQVSNAEPTTENASDNFDVASMTEQGRLSIGGDDKKAIELLSRIIKLKPNHGEAYIFRSVAYRNIKNYPKAIEDLNKVIEIDSIEHKKLAYNLRGEVLLEFKRYPEAMKSFDEAIKLYPDESSVFHWRGEAYLKIGKYHKAIEDFNKAIELNAGGGTYRSRGKAYSNLKNYQKAIQDFSKAMELNPNIKEYHMWRGNAYLKLNQYSDAINDFTMAIELDPKASVAYFNRFVASFILNQSDTNWLYYDFSQSISLDNIKIKNTIHDMINKEPDNPYNYYFLGMLLGFEKNHEKAIKYFNIAINLNPRNFRFYYDKGYSFYAQGKLAEAIRDFNISIELEQNYALSFYGRGNVYLDLKKFDNAIKDYSRAIELKSDLSQAYHCRGLCYLLEHKTELGCSDLKKACEMNFCDGLNAAMKDGKCF
jgi:tetratricopeptide (TPR) repeat protein